MRKNIEKSKVIGNDENISNNTIFDESSDTILESNSGTIDKNITDLDNNVSDNILDKNLVNETEDNISIVSGDIEEKNIDANTKLSKKEKKQKMKEANADIKLSDEIVNEKMKQALESQNPKKRKKTTIWSIILLIVNIVFLIFIVKNLLSDVEDFNFASLFHSQGHKLWWFLGGLIIYILFIFVQVVAYKILLKNLTEIRGKKLWKISYDVAVIGKYYDNVTPFAIGGQPMQIIALANNDVGAGVSTSIPLIKMIINTVITALLSLLFFVFGLPLISASTPLNQILMVLLEILGIIGVIVTVIVAIFMILISSGTLFTRSFIRGIIRFLYKIKLVKNYRQTFRKTLNQVAEYKFSMKYLWNNKGVLFSLLGLNLAEVVCLSTFTFIITMALSGTITENLLLVLFICMTKYYLCQMASSYVPLPGGTGLMEISFIILFGGILANNIVWGLLGWRFLSYYIIIIHGFIHELIKIFKNLSKNKKKDKIENYSEDLNNKIESHSLN